MMLITIDTLRADRVNAQVSPTLAQLGNEAVVFDRAVTVSPLTLPSHASLLTATYPPRHGVRDNTIFALPSSARTYTRILRGRGYATAAFVSAVVLDKRYGLAAGFDTYDDIGATAPERAARDTLARAEKWITANGQGRPFFVWVHLFEPHAPYLSGSYDDEVRVVDRELNQFFSRLRAVNIWDELVLSVTSDHGESLGEHGESTHGFFVYDATIRIPWVLKVPRGPRLRFAHQVRIVDVVPTMVSYAVPDVPLPPSVDGIDLRTFIERNVSPGLEAYSETFLPRDQCQWSELHAWRTARFKLVEAPRAELYDLGADPRETRNVVSERAADAERLRKILDAVRRTAAAVPRTTADPQLEEKFMALGYIGYAPESPARDGLPDPKDKIEVYQLTMSALELSETGRPTEALAALERAERLDANVTQVHYLKGTILGSLERYADAADALERAVRLNPRHVTARFKLALAYVRLGHGDRAERVLHTVLADEPRNVRAHHNLAAIAYARGDLAAAERLERQALEIDRSYFEAWNTLGAIYLMSKRPTDAINTLQTAVRLNPSSGQAQYNLALALRANGQQQAAADAAARACSLDSRYCPDKRGRR